MRLWAVALAVLAADALVRGSYQARCFKVMAMARQRGLRIDTVCMRPGAQGAWRSSPCRCRCCCLELCRETVKYLQFDAGG